MNAFLVLTALIALSAPPEAPVPLPAVLAGNASKGVRVHESTRDGFLADMAQDYAEQMAAIDSQSRRGEGHFGVEKRFAEIRKKLGMKGDEVSAESWRWQSNATPVELWKEMFRSWRKSPGHWAVVSKRHDRFGEGLAKSRSGIWYACIIVADRDEKLLFFTAEWCHWCKAMHPVIDQAKEEGIIVEEVDTDEQPELARKYRIEGWPTLVAIRSGREVARHVGATSLGRIKDLLKGRQHGSGEE